MSEASGDRRDLAERLLAGERRALLELNRLVTGTLSGLRAYDFRDEWEDLRQEVTVAVLENLRRDRLRDPRAFAGYVRIITRNKFVDRLKRQLRLREHEVLAWDDETARATATAGETRGGAPDPELWREVAQLGAEERTLVDGVYRQGKTYQEMAEETGIPLGTLKRRLRQALARLRERLSEASAGLASERGAIGGDPAERTDRSRTPGRGD